MQEAEKLILKMQQDDLDAAVKERAAARQARRDQREGQIDEQQKTIFIGGEAWDGGAVVSDCH